MLGIINDLEFHLLNGRLKLVKTFDFGIQPTTKKKFQNLNLNLNSKFATNKKKKLEIEENASNASTLTPRRRYLEGSRKEKKEEDFDFRNILRGRRDIIQEGRKKTKEEEKKKKKEEKKEEERKLLTEKENVLLLPGENLKNLIEIFEKFDNTGKKI